MGNNQTDSTDFDTLVIDEDMQIRALVKALKYSNGFSLYFARVDQSNTRHRVINRINELLPDWNIAVHNVAPNSIYLLKQLENIPNPQAICVTGIEDWLPKSEESAFNPLIITLNHTRDRFPIELKCPVVLVCAEYVFTALSVGAPDFYSVRSGSYVFSDISNKTRQLQSEALLEAKQRLMDYDALPDHQKDNKLYVSLLENLARISYDLGLYEETQAVYQRLLLVREQIYGVHDPKTESVRETLDVLYEITKS